MNFSRTPFFVTFTHLLLMYITSSSANSLINNITTNLSNKNTSTTNVPAVVMEGGGKPINEIFKPAPNLNDATTEVKLPQASTYVTSSINKGFVSIKPTADVPLEGGGNRNVQQPTSGSINPVANNHSLESNVHQINPTNHQTMMPSTSSISDVHKSTSSVVTEGGGKPELIKEPVPDNNKHDLKLPEMPVTKTPDPVIKSIPERIIPVSEGKPADEGSHQKIAPRKGVNNSEFTEYKKLENHTKPVIKKPLYTEASDDEPFIASHLEVNSKYNATSTNVKPKVPSLDTFNDFSNNSQQFVIPIVIVILSVPLVTIVISFLLKRGAEWWKYRHYRRMDFLINGIYDN